MKVSLALVLCICFLLPAGAQAQPPVCPPPVCPPGCGVGVAAQQGQYQGSTNIITGGTQIVGGGQASEIPRSPMIPMYPASAPNYPYFGGPYRWGRQLLALVKIVRYKSRWTSADLEKLASRPGKLNIAESIFTSYGPSLLIDFKIDQPMDGEDLRRFNQSYDLMGEIAADGFEKADSEKIMGEVGIRACKNGGNLVMLIQQDGNFRLDAKSRYTTIGISPGMVSGGSGAAGGGAILFSHTWGGSTVGYNTEPHATFLVFRYRGVRYIPYRPTSAAAAAQRQKSGQPTAGVADTKGKNQLPYKRPNTSVLQQEKY